MSGAAVAIRVEFGYPGHFAPASLKPLVKRRIAAFVRRYPGHFAPASLKHLPPNLNSVGSVGYPGHFAPASLKLAFLRQFDAVFRDVIRGISPRPH